MTMPKLCIGASDKIRESTVVPGRLIFNKTTNTMIIDSPTGQRLPLEILGISAISIDDCNQIATDINDSIYSYNNSFHVYKTSTNTANVPSTMSGNGNGIILSTVANGIAMQTFYSISSDGTFNGEWKRFGTVGTKDDGSLSLSFTEWNNQTTSDTVKEVSDLTSEIWATEGTYDISESSNTSILLEDEDDTFVEGYAQVKIYGSMRKIFLYIVIEHEGINYAVEYFRTVSSDGKSTDYILNSIEQLDDEDDGVNIVVDATSEYTREVSSTDVEGLIDTTSTLVSGYYTTTKIGSITRVELNLIVTTADEKQYYYKYVSTYYGDTRTKYSLVSIEEMS